MSRRLAPENPTIRGVMHRQTFQAMVNTIVGPSAPQVTSKGSMFYNVDRWTGRFLVVELCRWAKENPGVSPKEKEVRAWVKAANEKRVPRREIVVANCPDKLPRNVLYGIQGGGCHEGFHTVYSCRRDLNTEEVADIVLPRWSLVPNWSELQHLILNWSNIIEDIRIERLGRVEYPGTDPYLHDLQDFILEIESAGQENVRAHSAGETQSPKRNALSLITLAFRDLGLGYNTPRQTEAWESYLKENPEAVEFVREGPLQDPLLQATRLSREDDLGSLRIALDCIVELVKASRLPPPPPQQEEEKGQGNESGLGGEGEGEGDEKSKEGEDSSGGGESQEGKSSQGDESQEGKATPKGIAAQALEDAVSGAPLDVLDNNSALSQAVQEADARERGPLEEGEQPYRPWNPSLDLVKVVKPTHKGDAQVTAQKLLNSVRRECAYLRSRLAHLARSLEMVDTVHGLRKGKALSERMLVDSKVAMVSGISPKRAFYDLSERIDTSMAVAVTLDQSGSMGLCYGSSEEGFPGDGKTPCPKCQSMDLKLTNSSSAGRNQGSVICLNCKAAHQVKLRKKITQAARMLLAIVEPCERLGFPVQAVGFQNGALFPKDLPLDQDLSDFHRVSSKTHNVFKKFDEKLNRVLYRFGCLDYGGGTPLADGIQFGLDSLNYRDETHRVLLALTDGEPTEGYNVIPWQLRKAKEAGIHVIGVGIGPEGSGVQIRFEDHIWSPNIEDLPKLLVSKLSDIIDLRGSKKGKRMKGLALPT